MSKKQSQSHKIKVIGISQWLEIKYALLYNMGTFIITASGNFYEIGSQRIPAAMVEKPYFAKLDKKRNPYGNPIDSRQID